MNYGEAIKDLSGEHPTISLASVLKKIAAHSRIVPAARLKPNLVIGGSIVLFLILAALGAPLVAPYAPDQVMAGPRLAAPGLEHPFGTDALGRDLFSRVLYGAQLAVLVSLFGVTIAATLGIVPGLVAGYRGGWLDQVLSRGMDLWLAFPGLLLALVIVARLGATLQNAILALGIVSAPAFFRITRNQIISLRHAAFVEAAYAVGASETRILLRHIVPNLVSALIVTATLRAGILLLALGGLSFIGLGAQPPDPEWGSLLASGRGYIDTAPWLAIFPGLCLTITVLGINLFGDGLRDWVDPQMRRT